MTPKEGRVATPGCQADCWSGSTSSEYLTERHALAGIVNCKAVGTPCPDAVSALT